MVTQTEVSNGSSTEGTKQKVVIVGSGALSPRMIRQDLTCNPGIYGISTALYMLKDGNYDVTVLDKCGILPAPDAASTGESSSFLSFPFFLDIPIHSSPRDRADHTRHKQGISPRPFDVHTVIRLLTLQIIRAGDYADPQLAKLAIEAVQMWKLPEWEGTYHE